MSFPAGAPHQLLGTYRSFQVAPPLVSPSFAVVTCPVFLVVHLSMLCPVRILYLCGQQYPVESHRVLSSLLGFYTAGVPDVSFLTILMSFRFCAWRLAMESFRVLLVMRSFSNVPSFWTSALARLSREATICSPILVSVPLLAWILKSPPLASFWISRCLLKALVHCSFHCCHICWLDVVWRHSRHAGTRLPHCRSFLVLVVTIVALEMGTFESDAKYWHFYCLWK